MNISSLIQRLMDIEKEHQGAHAFVETDSEIHRLDSVRVDEDGDVVLGGGTEVPGEGGSDATDA